MLAAAGFPGGAGIEFEMLYPDLAAASYLEENALRFQSQMTETFPDMVIPLRGIADFTAYSQAQSGGNFGGVSYVITATPDAVIEAISQFRTEGSRNYGDFSEPVLDDILDRAIGELGIDARTDLLDEFQRRFVEEWQPLQVFFARPFRTMMQGDIGGYEQTAGTWYGYASLTKAHRWYYVG